MAISPDGDLVATVSRGSTLRIWNTIAGRQAAMLCGHRTEVENVSFSQNS